MGTQDTSWTVPPEVETALADDAQVRALRLSTAFTRMCSLWRSRQCHQHSSSELGGRCAGAGGRDGHEHGGGRPACAHQGHCQRCATLPCCAPKQHRDVVQLAALWEFTSCAAPGAEADPGAEDVTFSAEDIWPAAGSAPAAESAPAPLPPPRPQAEVEAEFRELLEEKGVRTLWVLPPQVCGIGRVRHACSLPAAAQREMLMGDNTWCGIHASQHPEHALSIGVGCAACTPVAAEQHHWKKLSVPAGERYRLGGRGGR